MASYILNWKELDNELIGLYKSDTNAVSKFASKYGISIYAVYYRLRKLGIKIKGRGSGLVRENHPMWKGGKSVTKRGYVLVNVGKGKQIAEHILVMEKKLGRKLKRGEIVHHIDESFEARSDNGEGNLQLTNRVDHAKHHGKQKGKGYCITYNSYTVNKWRLRIGSGSNGWKSAGLYRTKEDALVMLKKIRG